METDPISIILVKGDSKGDRLLFRYPYSEGECITNGTYKKKRNPYSIVINEDFLESAPQKTSYIENDRLVGFPDEVLSNLFAVKQELWEKKFELKTNDVRFVGHPNIYYQTNKKEEVNSSPTLVNIVFALRAIASHSIVRCYHELSKRLSGVLINEEKQYGYFSNEMKIMLAAHDEYLRGEEEGVDGLRNPFDVILEQSSFAKDLKRAFDDLCSSGSVQFRINKSRELSLCLPQKVHQLHNPAIKLQPEAIDRCFENLQPYHTMLLLVDTLQFLKSLSQDSSANLCKLLKVYTPIKCFTTLSRDSSLSMSEVRKVAGDLVYWGKAIVIYPLCLSNVYVIAPNTSIDSKSPLIQAFSDKFPHYSLLQVLSEYSLPISLNQKLSPLTYNHDIEIQVLVWLLQQRLVIQTHMYIYYLPGIKGVNASEWRGLPNERPTDDVVLPSASPGSGSEPSPVAASSPPTLAEGVSHSDLVLLNSLVAKGCLQGKQHLEDIMYQENVTRSELLQLTEKFRDVLVTFEHEDPNLAIFYPYSYLN